MIFSVLVEIFFPQKRFWNTPLERFRSEDSENIFSEVFDHRKASKSSVKVYCSLPVKDTVACWKNQFAGEDDTVVPETCRRRRHCSNTVAVSENCSLVPELSENCSLVPKLSENCSLVPELSEIAV